MDNSQSTGIYFEEVKKQLSRDPLVKVEVLLDSYSSGRLDVSHFALQMAIVLRLQPALLRKLNGVFKARNETVRIMCTTTPETCEIDLVAVISPYGGHIHAIPGTLAGSSKPKVRNSETLRELLLSSSEPWKELESLAPNWVSCLMELLQIEYKLFLDEHLFGGPFDRKYVRKCFHCLRKLAKKYGVLPPSYIIHEVAREAKHPVWGGGFADIWKGKLNMEIVCLKVLRIFTSVQVRDDLVKEFCYEALVWKQLDHPNVLPFLGVSIDLFAPSFCLISPWMETGNVMAYLETHPEHDRMTCITEIADGMNYLHNHNPPIVHADIRGANVLVKEDLRCCLADFGLSLVTESQIFDTTSIGQRGAVRWMAPELFAPSKFPKTEPSLRDIYAFGCTILEIYTGKSPFISEKMEVVVMNVVLAGTRPERPPPETGLSGNLWNLAQSCWAHHPQSRPSSTHVVAVLAEITAMLSINKKRRPSILVPASRTQIPAAPLSAKTYSSRSQTPTEYSFLQTSVSSLTSNAEHEPPNIETPVNSRDLHPEVWAENMRRMRRSIATPENQIRRQKRLKDPELSFPLTPLTPLMSNLEAEYNHGMPNNLNEMSQAELLEIADNLRKVVVTRETQIRQLQTSKNTWPVAVFAGRKRTIQKDASIKKGIIGKIIAHVGAVCMNKHRTGSVESLHHNLFSSSV